MTHATQRPLSRAAGSGSAILGNSAQAASRRGRIRGVTFGALGRSSIVLDWRTFTEIAAKRLGSGEIASLLAEGLTLSSPNASLLSLGATAQMRGPFRYIS